MVHGCVQVMTAHFAKHLTIISPITSITQHFQTTGKICTICDNIMVREKCSARKMVEYNDGKQCATVYHLGTHKCHIHINHNKKREDMLTCVKTSNTTSLLTANQLGRDRVGQSYM